MSEVEAELNEEAENDEGARDIRGDPSGVLDDLKDGGAVVVGEAGLVDGASGNAERVIHVDEHGAGVAGGSAQCEAAGEAARDVSAAVTLMNEFVEGEAEGVVDATGAELEPQVG